MRKNIESRLLCGLGLCFLVTFAASTPSARADVVAPDGTYAGRTYNDLQVLWWQSALSVPVVNNRHPVISAGAFGSIDRVLFLSAAGGSANLTISADTALFFPVVNVECSVLEQFPFHGDDEASLCACAEGHIDNTSGRFARIDGVPVDLASFRFKSPLFQWPPLPENNIAQFSGLNAPAGTTTDAVDAGYYLLLTPLSVGNHVINFGGTYGEPIPGSTDTTYNITVVPEPVTLIPVCIGVVTLLGNRRRRSS
jgi:hypothetical protein